MLADVLLVPGLLCDGRLWTAQVEALRGAARCHTPDLTAYESVVAMADGVLNAAPERFALAGFSLGGCVALEMVARAPERVTRPALLDTTYHGLLPPVREQYLAAIPLIEAGGLRAYLAEAFPRYVAAARVRDRGLWETLAAMGESLGPVVAVQQMRALAEYLGFAGLGRIACPTVVICGSEDRRASPGVHAEMARQVPGATLRVIERAGHFTPLEQPQAVAEALRDWLGAPA
jgi:pimeloyl-ACP methyl ester carboxylesterase